MRFGAEQEELRAAVRALLDRRPPAGGPDAGPSPTDDTAWRRLAAEIGAHALAIPERYGGLGHTCAETHVVLEELGRALTPVPFLGSVVLCGQALLACEDEDAKAEWLPRLADGSLVGALAWAEAGSVDPARLSVRAQPAAGGGWRLTGVKEHVLEGHRAGLLLVPARRPDGGLAVFAVDPAARGVRVVELVPVDLSRPQSRVVLETAPATLVGRDGEGVLRHVLDAACTALSAEQVGGAAHCLEATVAHAQQRVQFGRPIGAFQAVRHRLADMLVLLEGARSASYAAAFALAGQAPDRGEVAALAASSCAEAFRTIAGEAIQLHGGIGVTWEHECHRYFKRAHGSALLFGSPEWHRARLAPAVGLPALDRPSRDGGW